MYLSPELLRRTDELISRDLSELHNWYFLLVLIFAGMVALGVILEGPEVIHEFRSKPGTSHRPWVKKAGLIGWVLVALGVAGEVVFEELASWADGASHAFSDILLADARKQAAQAEAVARSFESRIAESKMVAAEANERAKKYEAGIAEANARAKSAEAQVASANAMAAEARSMAESERLERLKLEARFAPRHLTLDQQRQIRDRLRAFTDRTIRVSSYGLDVEGAILAEQIIGVLPPRSKIIDSRAGVISAGTFDMGVHVRGPTEAQDFVLAIASALNSIGGLQVSINTGVASGPRLMGSASITGNASLSGGGPPGPGGPTAPGSPVWIEVGIKPVANLP